MRLVIIHPTPCVAAHVAEYFDHPNVFASLEDDVRKIPVDNTAFVSPANSLLFMDGGIDHAYSRDMFPGVEAELKRMTCALGMKTALGRSYLPVGSAIVAPTGLTSCLVAAPTMFLPHDVSATRNAYHAMMAALIAFSKYRRSHPDIQTLVCPLLCTGYGRMTVDDARFQMRHAYRDFLDGRTPDEISHASSDSHFITNTFDAEQPSNFDNREINVSYPRLL